MQFYEDLTNKQQKFMIYEGKQQQLLPNQEPISNGVNHIAFQLKDGGRNDQLSLDLFDK